jgi:hypothetical protein
MCCLHLICYLLPPPPGYSIAVLGLLGIIMSFRLGKKPEKVGKAEVRIWLGVCFGLMALEMWAITHDRHDQDAKYRDEANQRQMQFESTVAQLKSIETHVVEIPASLSPMEHRLEEEIAAAKHGAVKSVPTLKEKALQIAKEITDFLNLRSDEASRLGGSSDASRTYNQQNVEQFEESVEAEWNRRFASRVTEITDQLKLAGVMPKVLNDSCEKPSPGWAVLRTRSHCAERIEKAALQLK